MQPPLVDPENLFRLVHFFDVLAAIVFAVSGALVASRKDNPAKAVGQPQDIARYKRAAEYRERPATELKY